VSTTSESTSAALHRLERERDELIAETARLSVAAGQAHRERDLARAELASACAELEQLRAAVATASSPSTITHLCPADGEALTPCCRRTPFELPQEDRMTLVDTGQVNCQGGAGRG
jgi:hypothetical protein